MSRAGNPGSAANQPSLKVGYALRTDLAPEAIIGRERSACMWRDRKRSSTTTRKTR